MNSQMQKEMVSHIRSLQRISGLAVTHYREKGQSVYQFFGLDDFTHAKAIKTCFTYPKAKLFAQGVAYGKQLAS
jgi:hypothetical protein